jgi:hypothetical protein
MTVRRATSAIALSLLAALYTRDRPSQVLDHPGRPPHFAARDGD